MLASRRTQFLTENGHGTRLIAFLCTGKDDRAVRVALDGGVAGRVCGRRGGDQRLGQDGGAEARARKGMRRVHAARLERNLRKKSCRFTKREQRIVQFLLAVHEEKGRIAQAAERNNR